MARDYGILQNIMQFVSLKVFSLPPPPKQPWLRRPGQSINLYNYNFTTHLKPGKAAERAILRNPDIIEPLRISSRVIVVQVESSPGNYEVTLSLRD
jgi:hypothetical protein